MDTTQPPSTAETGAVSQKKRIKFLSGAFAGSLAVHAIILINVGAVVLISGNLKPKGFVSDGEIPLVAEDKAEEIQENPAPSPQDAAPEDAPAPTVAGGPSNPSQADTGPSTLELLTTTSNVTAFSVPSGANPLANALGNSTKVNSGSNGTSGAGSGPIGGGSLFGSNTKSLASLTGYLYDLKQNQHGDRPPAGTNLKKIVTEVATNWRLGVLKDYYKARKPLYLSQLFIPAIHAEEAPKAFGVEKDVKPSQWMACYSGNIKAPESGNYRFIGFGDDYLIVRLKGQVVFDGSYHNIFPDKTISGDFGKAYSMPDRSIGSNLLASPWFALEKDVEIPMEVVISEDPGGYFSSLLLIEKQGQADPKPSPFRLDRVELPNYRPGYDGPEVGHQDMLFGVPPS